MLITALRIGYVPCQSCQNMTVKVANAYDWPKVDIRFSFLLLHLTIYVINISARNPIIKIIKSD